MSMLSRVLPLLSLILLAACSSPPPLVQPSSQPWSPSFGGAAGPVGGAVNFSPSPVSALPDWSQQDLTSSLQAMRQSCRIVARQPAWSAPCQTVASIDSGDNAAIRRFFESSFTAWKMRDGARDSGLITGYYEPMLSGSRSRSDRTPYPLYGVPADLVTLNLPPAARGAGSLLARRVAANRLVLTNSAGADTVTVNPADFPGDNHAVLKGRIDNGRLLPYYTRAEIAAGRGIDSAPVLAWVDDAVELFFLQVQGAGRIQMDDGSVLRVGVGDNNGYAYQSIGRWLAAHGEPASSTSMAGIQNWVRAHPDQQQTLFNVNPRFIFFRAMSGGSDEGPVGAQGVPLTNGYSIAVDPHYIPLGTPVYLATTQPTTQAPLNRLVVAQDTGNAIRGALRADFFWGYGADAGAAAGHMRQSGSLWLLLPNGMQPSI
jgi:membrane-bound lytic murein transglycosylase A